MTTYYTLLTREHSNQPWAIEFGDYDLDCVKDVQLAITSGLDAPNTKIIRTDEAQSAIDARVAELNTPMNLSGLSDEQRNERACERAANAHWNRISYPGE